MISRFVLSFLPSFSFVLKLDMCLVFVTVLLFLMCIPKNNAADIYGNVGDDITFSWMLDPIPSQIDIVGVNASRGRLLFQVLGTTTIVEPAYTGRIIYNGNTTAGQMRFILKSLNSADAGLYTTKYNGNIIYPGRTLYVYGKPTRPTITAKSAPVVNHNLQLNCSTTSTTIPKNHNLTLTYRWNINGVKITSSTGRYIINGSLITIQNINLYDGNSTVTCTGTEQGGLTSLISDLYTIIVEYGPGTVTFTPSTTSFSPTELNTIPDITCSANCNPNCYYRWTKDGHVTSHGFGSNLSLRNINRNDTGAYRCSAWNNHGRKNSFDINVDVKYGPGTVTFTPSTTSYSPTELGTIPDITCRADCNPNCYFRWTKDGQVTSHGSGSTLSLRNTNRNDTGVYRCTASNDHGIKNSTDINVDVKYGPGSSVGIMPMNTTFTYIENTTVSTKISCRADCNPKCTYSWNATQNSNPLIFGKVDRGQAGRYFCTATNEVGSAEVFITLIVQYPSRVIRSSSIDIKAKESQNITLTCPIDAVPLPIAVWSKNNGTTFTTEIRPSNPSLFQIGSANCVDTGYYTCTVDNHITEYSLDYNTYRLNVDCEPRVFSTNIENKVIYLMKGQTLNINTSFIAFPLPNITWNLNSAEIVNTKNHAINLIKIEEYLALSMLYVPIVTEKDFGIYTVLAENHMGKTLVSYKVEEQRNPNQPSDVTVRCLGHDSAIIIWISDNTADLYHILYQSRDKEYSLSVKNPVDKKLIIEEVTGLDYSSFYIFLIIAKNSFGMSYSDEVNCTTYDKPKKLQLSGGAIAGSVVGGFVLAFIIIGFLIIVNNCMRKRKQRTTEQELRIKENQNQNESKYEMLQTIREQSNSDGPGIRVSNEINSNNAGSFYETLQSSGNASIYEDINVNGKTSPKEKTVYANTVIT